MAVYTDKRRLVADTHAELEIIAKDLLLFKESHYVAHRRRPHYLINAQQLREAYRLGVLLRPAHVVDDVARKMLLDQKEWYKRATDEEIEKRVRSLKEYIHDTRYIFEGRSITGADLTEMSIEMFKTLREGKEFDVNAYVLQHSIDPVDTPAPSDEKPAETMDEVRERMSEQEAKKALEGEWITNDGA